MELSLGWRIGDKGTGFGKEIVEAQLELKDFAWNIGDSG